MTTLDERLVTAPAATDHDLATFRIGMAAYIGTHRHGGHAANRTADPEAQRAGLSAVLADRDRHPAVAIHTGLMRLDTLDDVASFGRVGWELIGHSTLISGATVYWMHRAEPAPDGGQ